MSIPAQTIIREINDASPSDLPGILAAVVRACVKHKAFKKLRVCDVVAKLEGESNEGSR